MHTSFCIPAALFNPSACTVQADDAGSPSVDGIVADWILSAAHVKEGTSVNAGNLVIQDASGNGNDLKLVISGTPAYDTVSFNSDNSSLHFENPERMKPYAPNGRYLKTVEDAAVNSMTFENGFTIEAEFKIDPDRVNNWMGILTRQGTSSDVKGEPVTTLSISNIHEIQWTSTPVQSDSTKTGPLLTFWSSPIDRIKPWAQKPDAWTHVAIVNDGSMTKIYINGIEEIRNPSGLKIIKGIARDLQSQAENFGWNIGCYHYDNMPNTLFYGDIKRIRIAGKALRRDEFLVTSFDYTVENGSNDDSIKLFNDNTYSFAFIPDPQYVTQAKPGILESQLKFIRDNSQNVRMAVCIGDLVQDGEAYEWEAADKAFRILDDANVPYATTRGNHDRQISDYVNNFGPDRFTGKAFYGGASPSGRSSYVKVNAGSYEYLFINIDTGSGISDEELNWAKEIMSSDENKNLPTVFFTHDALYPDGSDSVSETGAGAHIWDKLIKDNNQVFMMVSGHISGSGRRIKENSAGNGVIQILTDYQSEIRGGSGYTTFVEFDENADKLRVKTFSPYINSIPRQDRTYIDLKYLTTPCDMYDIDFNFSKRFTFEEKLIIPTEVSLNKISYYIS